MSNGSILDKIKIVLVEPSHNGNIGSTARAMLNMGITKLCLVNPKKTPDDEALALASHATDVVNNAEIVETLEQALENIDYVVGTSARVRRMSLPIEPIEKVVSKCLSKVNSGENIAILFGRERTGLLNNELMMSNIHAYIPSNENYTSLNLAQEVQLICYEIYKQSLVITRIREVPEYNHAHKKASVQEKQGLYKSIEDNMIATGFLDKNNPGHVMDKVKRLFQRSDLESQEVNILRGFLSSLNNKGR